MGFIYCVEPYCWLWLMSERPIGSSLRFKEGEGSRSTSSYPLRCVGLCNEFIPSLRLSPLSRQSPNNSWGAWANHRRVLHRPNGKQRDRSQRSLPHRRRQIRGMHCKVHWHMGYHSSQTRLVPERVYHFVSRTNCLQHRRQIRDP